MTLTLDPTTHTYRVDGRIVPGVSDILQAAGLGTDLSMVPPEVRERKAKLGTYVHSVCAMILQGKEPPYTEVSDGYAKGFKLFLNETGFRAMDVETTLYHWSYDFCGTPDAWGHLKAAADERVIIDVKTPLRSSRSWHLQLAAYRLLIASNYPLTLDQSSLALQLKPNGTYKLVPCDDPLAEQAFLAALAHYRGEATDATRAVLDAWRTK